MYHIVHVKVVALNIQLKKMFFAQKMQNTLKYKATLKTVLARELWFIHKSDSDVYGHAIFLDI